MNFKISKDVRYLLLSQFAKHGKKQEDVIRIMWSQSPRDSKIKFIAFGFCSHSSLTDTDQIIFVDGLKIALNLDEFRDSDILGKTLMLSRHSGLIFH